MARINWSSDCTTNRLPIAKSNVIIFNSFFQLTNLALAKMAKDYLAMQGWFMSAIRKKFFAKRSHCNKLKKPTHPETVRSAKSWLKQINSKFFILF